ncbi:methyltransferase family protein [Taklimakanibacter lacteus]|uniref:methyltransferase family protein n=1 Tax=Taklimakanibacter lacteus TaxID=2268456 RepID=UPI000E674755
MSSDPAHDHMADTATAGVIARPPFIFLASLLLGYLLHYLLPLPFSPPWPDLLTWIVAGVLILVGLTVFAAGIRNFSTAGTPVPTNEPTRALVTTGIHGRTRNPIYVGMFLVYAGIGIGVQSLWILILLLPLAVVINYGVVAREEAYLEKLFGEEYRTYKARVRRWI